MNNQFIYDHVTNQVIKSLEELDRSNWEKPWITVGAGYPFNPITKKHYRGINIFLLSCAGFQNSHFASFKQWTGKGYKIKKGSKGTMVVFWKINKYKDKDQATGEDKTKTVPVLRYYTVFNGSQIEDYKGGIADTVERDPVACDKQADQFFHNTEIRVTGGADQACYSPTLDLVRMPDRNQFKDTKYSTAFENYYSTLAHEFTHATGHKDRLNRDLTGRFKSDAYAFEELIAEMGAVYAMAYLGLSSAPRKDHAHYLKSWLSVLKRDSKAIITASSQAQKALEFMIKKQGIDSLDDSGDDDSE